MLGPVHNWAQNRLILAIVLPFLAYRSFPCCSWNPLFAPALLLGHYLHWSPCPECEEAVQVRKLERTQALNCTNCFTDCFADCKETLPGLARLTSPLPACGFSVSSTPLAGTRAVQDFLEWLCAGWWRPVPGGASLGEDILTLLEGDHCLFLEDILAMMMSGGNDCTCGWSTSMGFFPQSCELSSCSTSAYNSSSRASLLGSSFLD